jgi:tryptophan synthase alpha chain
MNRIDATFKRLRQANQKAFISFITAGYPNLNVTEKLVLEFDRIGVDIIELGVPFSDPMADGPIIQEASQAALKNKVNLAQILALVRRLRQRAQVPICLMTYYNPVFRYGEEAFVKAAVCSGVDGVIVPDLPLEEAHSLRTLSRKSSLDLVCFIAPTTSGKRVKSIAQAARGFIYYVSLTGVTGSRTSLPADIAYNIRQVKKATSKPVCVGFGISRPEQVRDISRVADGVIVGSAIVGKIKENIGKKDLVQKVSGFVRMLLGSV